MDIQATKFKTGDSITLARIANSSTIEKYMKQVVKSIIDEALSRYDEDPFTRGLIKILNSQGDGEDNTKIHKEL